MRGRRERVRSHCIGALTGISGDVLHELLQLRITVNRIAHWLPKSASPEGVGSRHPVSRKMLMTDGKTDLVNQRILVIDDNPAIHHDFDKILSGGATGDDGLSQAERLLFG